MSAEHQPRLLLSIPETAALLGWKLTKTYEAARRNELPGVIKINKRYHVRRLVVLAWLAGDDGAAGGRPAAREGA